MPDEQDVEVAKGLNLYALVPALIDCTPRLFQQNPTDIRATLIRANLEGKPGPTVP
jgi:hypothetical protein